jgi:hypothetical protein
MMNGAAVDTSTMLVLAAIALAEGVERVPAGSVVLRRFLNGAWQIEEPGGHGDRLRLVHWWSPWTEAIVVPPGPGVGPRPSRADLVSRLAAIVTVRRTARMIGAATLLLLIIGVPAAFGLVGAVGGLVSLGGVFAGQVALAFLGWRGLGLLHLGRRQQLRSLLPNLNPFAAPGVASRLMASAVSGATPATVAQTLLSPGSWTKWFRPQAYDAAIAQTVNRDPVKAMEAAEETIADVLSQRPEMTTVDVLWCPRCASTYQAGSLHCADCNIPLLTASQSVATLVRLRAASNRS